MPPAQPLRPSVAHTCCQQGNKVSPLGTLPMLTSATILNAAPIQSPYHEAQQLLALLVVLSRDLHCPLAVLLHILLVARLQGACGWRSSWAANEGMQSSISRCVQRRAQTPEPFCPSAFPSLPPTSLAASSSVVASSFLVLRLASSARFSSGGLPSNTKLRDGCTEKGSTQGTGQSGCRACPGSRVPHQQICEAEERQQQRQQPTYTGFMPASSMRTVRKNMPCRWLHVDEC